MMSPASQEIGGAGQQNNSSDEEMKDEYEFDLVHGHGGQGPNATPAGVRTAPEHYGGSGQPQPQPSQGSGQREAL